MVVSIEFWQFLCLLVAFFSACAAAGKALLNQTQRHLDERFSSIGARLDGIEEANRDEVAQWRRVERDLAALKSDLPQRYVMRDDYIRGMSVIEAKIDGLAMRLENAQLRGLVGVQKNDD